MQLICRLRPPKTRDNTLLCTPIYNLTLWMLHSIEMSSATFNWCGLISKDSHFVDNRLILKWEKIEGYFGKRYARTMLCTYNILIMHRNTKPFTKMSAILGPYFWVTFVHEYTPAILKDSTIQSLLYIDYCPYTNQWSMDDTNTSLPCIRCSCVRAFILHRPLPLSWKWHAWLLWLPISN